MKARAKRLPRLWCALQGLLPLEACLAAQRAELAWMANEAARKADSREGGKPKKSETRRALP
jgi:hypothetical protein